MPTHPAVSPPAPGHPAAPRQPSRPTSWRGARVSLAFGLAAALAACGGGSGSGTPAGNAVTLSYSVQIYPAGQLARQQDMAYSVRPNPAGTEITSDLRAQQELGGNQLTMYTEVLMPPDAGPASPRPLLIWLHGGGLVSGNKETLRPYTEAWTRAGYVTANIDYRLNPQLAGDASLHTSAVLHAAEDFTSAVRYLRSHATQYAIDTGRIATIGYSSGGEVVMAQRINASGNSCTTYEQRNGQHMADLNFGSGADFPAMDSFLRQRLRLP